MGEERVFYKVPVTVVIHCRQCGCRLTGPTEDKPADEYYMTDDSSWIYCVACASAKEKPHGPKRRLYPEHERVPLHKKRTLRERAERCQM